MGFLTWKLIGLAALLLLIQLPRVGLSGSSPVSTIASLTGAIVGALIFASLLKLIAVGIENAIEAVRT